MPELTAGSCVLVAVAAIFTAAAAVWDLRERRIPNKLTAPVFLAGVMYQAAFHGLAGLGDAALAFLLGFGTLFVLWMIGGGGGGDVKLMGALSVWLGFHMTLLVIIVSTVLVVVGTGGFVVYSAFSGGLRRTSQQRSAAEGTNPDLERRPAKSAASQRRIMAYALPVALATWAVLIWKLPTLP